MSETMLLQAGLGSAGGALALVFIVGLAVGIVTLTLFYLGSAILVLERFARVQQRKGSVFVFFVGTTILVAAAIMESTQAFRGVLPFSEEISWWLGSALAAALGVAASMALVFFVMRAVRPQSLAVAAVVWAGLGAAIVLGSSGSIVVPVASLVFAAALWWLFSWRHRRLGQSSSGTARVLARALFGAFCVGLLLGEVAFLRGGADSQAGLLGSAVLFGLLVPVLLGLVPLAAAGFVDLRRTVEWFIAVRYLVARRRQVFISAITAICVVGIAAGVWLIIVVLSVMNGFEQTWRDEILGNRAHFSLHSRFGPFGDYEEVLEGVRSAPGVTGASAFLEADGMVRGEEGGVFAVRVRGVQPESVGLVSDLENDLVLGSIEDLEGGEDSDDPGILLGSQLAVSLGVGLGDPLLLISPFGGPQTPLGPAPRLERFRVVGIYQSTFFQHEEVYTYVSLSAAQDFRRTGDVIDGVDARTSDFYRSRVVANGVIDALDGPYYTRDWKEYFPAFFQALKSERVMMFLLLTMIMVVAAFVIVATLMMMIMEKSNDIAILKAMGAEDAAIERIFAIEGTLIGIAGTGFGVVAGIAVTDQLAWIQARIEAITGVDTLPASVYQLSTLPSEVDPIQVAIVVGIAMVLSLGATLLPSRQGARVDPAEALRHE